MRPGCAAAATLTGPGQLREATIREKAMLGRGVLALFGAFLAMALTAGPALADAGVKSSLRETKPAVAGLEVEVVGGDKFLLLRNGTSKQVIVQGYEDEPYLRFRPDRVVEENVRSPSKYANEDRYALTPLPPQADSG